MWRQECGAKVGFGFTLFVPEEQSQLVGQVVGQVGQVLRVAEHEAIALQVHKRAGRKDLNLRPPGPEPGTTNPINAFSGVAYGTTGVISPLLLVPNLYLELRDERERCSHTWTRLYIGFLEFEILAKR